MNTSEDAVVSHITLHNPPSCTCARIIWLSMNCDAFAMNIGTANGDAHIDARLGSVYRSTRFHPEALKETVNDLFWEIWAVWEPEEGIKVMERG
ncbi:hypothetical protein FHW04_000537 [Pantoea sp. AN62]|uniref:Uncharacterized protein n=1 Tax=Pantoea brenneri TaxID=472694 RepID=A0ABU9MLT5_9GAMM|nr:MULTISPECIES: hypothetical protein [Pantoea]MCQ5472385.1 hypothetical protein [Pantoea brenneri]MDH1085252.1 hypothetical protein [Pantoea brenneri]MDU4125579.1 hypothetical protein [Pantoea sp.]MDU4744976.1 hypothetical protein [Pantoea sp.]